MGAPITDFEIIESVRFFAQLVGTEGLSMSNNQIANDYIEKLLKSLESSVNEATATKAGLSIVR